MRSAAHLEWVPPISHERHFPVTSRAFCAARGWRPLASEDSQFSAYICMYNVIANNTYSTIHNIMIPKSYTITGLHKLWYPGIRDTSTWSKFGAHGEHGDVFLFSNLGAL